MEKDSVQSCPKCRLVSPDSALRCDCGYDFGTQTMQQSYLSLKERQPAVKSRAEIVFGYIWDAVLQAGLIWMFFTSRGWPQVIYVISIACLGAGKIWRHRKYLAPHWSKLISH